VDDLPAFYIVPKKAGVTVAIHLYAQGGHAFGLWKTKYPIGDSPSIYPEDGVARGAVGVRVSVF